MEVEGGGVRSVVIGTVCQFAHHPLGGALAVPFVEHVDFDVDRWVFAVVVALDVSTG